MTRQRRHVSGQEVLGAGFGEVAGPTLRLAGLAGLCRWFCLFGLWSHTLTVLLEMTPKSAGSGFGSLPGSEAQLGVSVSR